MLNHVLNNYLLFLFEFITVLFVFFILFVFILYFLFKKYTLKVLIKSLNNDYLITTKYLCYFIFNKYERKLKINNLNLIYKKKFSNNIFILLFNADLYVKDIMKIKFLISQIILIANKNDIVFLKLTSSGGFVNNYGLAANEFERLRSANIKLIVAIDLIAASGGYLIAAVANEIIAAEFAIIGSIGVLGVVPNINRLLEKNSIDIEHHTSCDYKTTLSFLGKNSEKGRQKFKESLEIIQFFFNNFIKKYRKNIDVNRVFTGEYWHGRDALKLGLIDKIQTSEDFILDNMQTSNIYELNFLNTSNNKVFNFFKE